ACREAPAAASGGPCAARSRRRGRSRRSSRGDGNGSAPRRHHEAPAARRRVASVRAQPCARLRAASSARRANTRQRCALYSTEPCRSGWTSTPSAAFWAAASIVAASSFLLRSAASTPLARTALVPAPVTPTPPFLHTPDLSTVTAAQTPPTPKRQPGS